MPVWGNELLHSALGGWRLAISRGQGRFYGDKSVGTVVSVSIEPSIFLLIIRFSLLPGSILSSEHLTKLSGRNCRLSSGEHYLERAREKGDKLSFWDLTSVPKRPLSTCPQILPAPVGQPRPSSV